MRPCAPCSETEPIARILVTRPAALAAETASRLLDCGHDVIVAPLLDPVALPWEAPAGQFDAIALTSPQAPALAGPAAARFHHMPAYAVGARTASAAEAAGFTDVRIAPAGDAQALVAAIAADGRRRVLHLAGKDHRPPPPSPNFGLVTCPVYEARLVADLTDEARAALAAGRVDWTLLFSARTSAHFADLCDRHGVDRARLSIAAISPAALAAAGVGWRRALAAVDPSETGILAAAGLLCDSSPATSD